MFFSIVMLILGAVNLNLPKTKTNVAPENQWLKDEISFWDGVYVQGL